MSKTKTPSLLENFLNIPVLAWVMLGFFVSYLLFFIRPIFFLNDVMQFFKYVPAQKPIGIDLNQVLGYCQSWWIDKQTPYIGTNPYPPFATAFFTPLLIVGFSQAYKIITLASLFCYIVITFILPLRQMGRVSPLLVLVSVTGLLSYGFQFEIERGQFNVIAACLCFLAIWIYHFHHKYRYLAYCLFIISVQLKIFPFIFIVMFVGNWRDWKNNTKRFLALAAANFALLFSLGPTIFLDFIKAITARFEDPFLWIGNHSIHSFVTILWEDNPAWPGQYSGLAQIFLLAIVIVCLFMVLLQAYRNRQSGINPYLLLACALAALMIPSLSHDYTLSVLAAPVAILFSKDEFFFSTSATEPRKRFLFILLTLVFSIAYSSTLFSYTNKPLALGNNFPALFIMLLIVTVLSALSISSIESGISSNP